MNSTELKNIEAWLDRVMQSPETGDGYGAIARHAETQRAEALAGAIRTLGARLAAFAETIRHTAESCTAARLHHNHG